MGTALTTANRSVTVSLCRSGGALLRSRLVVGRLPSWRVPVLLSATLLSACGGGGGHLLTTPSPGLATGGYLARDAGWVDFIEFTATGTSLAGSFDEATLQGATVNHQHYAFSGVVSGASVTLTFPAGLGFQTTLSGEWHDRTITLSVPQQDGTLASVDFAPSDTNQYNDAVKALEGQAAVAQQRQAEASAAAAAEEQQRQADNAVASLADRVNSDIAQLQKVSFDNDLKSGQQDLANQQKDLGTMRKDEQQTEAESDPSMRCGDASLVEGDESLVQGDVTEAEGDQSSLNGDISTAQDVDVAGAASDLAKLQTAEGNDPGYSGSVPSANDVTSAIAAVKKGTQQAASTMDGYVSQAKATASSAQSEAQAFYAKYCTS